MRVVGMILVILGALTLGYQGFGFGERAADAPEARKQSTLEKGENEVIPPVAGGIAVTSGLILIVSGLKRV